MTRPRKRVEKVEKKKSKRSERKEEEEEKTKDDKRALKLVLQEAERYRKSPKEKEKEQKKASRKAKKEAEPEEEEEESSEREPIEEDDATHSSSEEEDSEEDSLFEEPEGRCADGMYVPLEWVPHMEPNKHISSICLASRNSGKSYLMRSLIKNSLRGFFDLYIVISDTADTRKEYKEAAEEEEGVMCEAFDHLPHALWDNIKAEHDQAIADGVKPLSICIILDDASAMGVGQDQQLLSLYCNARHCATSIFWSLHHPRVVSTIIRANSDLIIVLKIKAPQMKESVIKNLLMGSIDFPQLGLASPKSEKKFFESALSTFCKNQGDALVLDQRPRNQRGNDTEEELFRYRAPKEVKRKPVKEDDRPHD
jgi:hypothetical protein